MPMSISLALVDWLHHKALMTYPNLKIALIESGIGWIPFVLERAGFVHQQHGAWTHTDFGGKHPIDVYREHFLATFVDDQAGLRLLDVMGQKPCVSRLTTLIQTASGHDPLRCYIRVLRV